MVGLLLVDFNALSFYTYSFQCIYSILGNTVLDVVTASVLSILFFFNTGDPEELGGCSRRRWGFGTGVWADALPPRPGAEDASHAAHAVPLLRQVSRSHLPFKPARGRNVRVSGASLIHQ